MQPWRVHKTATPVARARTRTTRGRLLGEEAEWALPWKPAACISWMIPAAARIQLSTQLPAQQHASIDRRCHCELTAASCRAARSLHSGTPVKGRPSLPLHDKPRPTHACKHTTVLPPTDSVPQWHSRKCCRSDTNRDRHRLNMSTRPPRRGTSRGLQCWKRWCWAAGTTPVVPKPQHIYNSALLDSHKSQQQGAAGPCRWPSQYVGGTPGAGPGRWPSQHVFGLPGATTAATFLPAQTAP
jgi:hypothetical protein